MKLTDEIPSCENLNNTEILTEFLWFEFWRLSAKKIVAEMKMVTSDCQRTPIKPLSYQVTLVTHMIQEREIDTKKTQYLKTKTFKDSDNFK